MADVFGLTMITIVTVTVQGYLGSSFLDNINLWALIIPFKTHPVSFLDTENHGNPKDWDRVVKAQELWARA